MGTKIVTKPWGHESWIADGSQTPYAIKRILFLKNNRTSLQVHRFKSETNYVLSGEGVLYKSISPFDIDAFLLNGMTTDEVDTYEKTCMEPVLLLPGVVVNLDSCIVHRVVAVTDLEFIEVSTCQLEDVYRLQDDAGRAHGKILSEHRIV